MSVNKDMPAMPCTKATGEVFEGLTKREMFAMNAPNDIPKWFKRSFIKSNYSNKDFVTSFTALAPESAKLSFDGEMALLKAWRYAYADMMLSE